MDASFHAYNVTATPITTWPSNPVSRLALLATSKPIFVVLWPFMTALTSAFALVEPIEPAIVAIVPERLFPFINFLTKFLTNKPKYIFSTSFDGKENGATAIPPLRFTPLPSFISHFIDPALFLKPYAISMSVLVRMRVTLPLPIHDLKLSFAWLSRTIVMIRVIMAKMVLRLV